MDGNRRRKRAARKASGSWSRAGTLRNKDVDAEGRGAETGTVEWVAAGSKAGGTGRIPIFQSSVRFFLYLWDGFD